MERLTRDIDLFIKMTPENIESLQNALNSLYNDDSIKEITFDELQKFSVIRYGTPNEFYVDIMTHLGEAVSFDDLDYELLEYHGTTVRIATPETSYNLKKDTVRQKDKMDAMFLERTIIDRGNNKIIK